MVRLGLVVPSSNTTVEPEVRALAPSGSTVHAARMPLEDVTPETLDEMAESAERAAQLLSHAAVDGIAYACTTGSLLHGPGFDAELESRLADVTGAPAVATARSVKRALEALEAETIAVVTPYTTDLDDLERQYLEAVGFEVASVDGRGLVENTAIGELTPEDAGEQVRSAVGSATAVDAVFVSCTNYRSLDSVPSLEADLGVPVLTSNLATFWDLANRVGVEPRVDVALGGTGRLR